MSSSVERSQTKNDHELEVYKKQPETKTQNVNGSRSDITCVPVSSADEIRNVFRNLITFGEYERSAQQELQRALEARNWKLAGEAVKKGGMFSNPVKMCVQYLEQDNPDAAYFLAKQHPFDCLFWEVKRNLEAEMQSLRSSNEKLYLKFARFYYKNFEDWCGRASRLAKCLLARDFETAKILLEEGVSLESLYGDYYNGVRFEPGCLALKPHFKGPLTWLCYSTFYLCSPEHCNKEVWKFWLDHCHLVEGCDDGKKGGWLADMVFQGRLDIAALLLEKGANPNVLYKWNHRRIMDCAPLEFAVLNDDPDGVRLLLQNKASPYVQYKKDKKPPYSIFDVAQERGNLKVIMAFSGHVNNTDQKKISAYIELDATLAEIKNTAAIEGTGTS